VSRLRINGAVPPIPLSLFRVHRYNILTGMGTGNYEISFPDVKFGDRYGGRTWGVGVAVAPGGKGGGSKIGSIMKDKNLFFAQRILNFCAKRKEIQ